MTDTNDLRPLIRAALETGDKSGGVMTRDGREVVIHELACGLIYGRVRQMPVHWTAQGRALTAGLRDSWGIIPRPAPKKRVKGWVNVYANGSELSFHETRERADRMAMPSRIACIQIDVEEGEGLS